MMMDEGEGKNSLIDAIESWLSKVSIVDLEIVEVFRPYLFSMMLAGQFWIVCVAFSLN